MGQARPWRGLLAQLSRHRTGLLRQDGELAVIDQNLTLLGMAYYVSLLLKLQSQARALLTRYWLSISAPIQYCGKLKPDWNGQLHIITYWQSSAVNGQGSHDKNENWRLDPSY